MAKNQVHHMTGIMIGQEQAITALGNAAQKALTQQELKAIDAGDIR